MTVATTIIKGNRIFTGLANEPQKLAIAIQDNRIVAVDCWENIARWQGNSTEVIEVGDKLVMPGFHDAHMHIMLGSVFSTKSVSLFNATTANEAVQMVVDYAKTQTTRDWIIGTGWDHTAWGDTSFPTREQLDVVLKDRPIVLLHAEGHYGWVNTKALELANITKDTENPDYGIIVKDENGEPTGILIETAISMATDLAYDFSKDTFKEMVESFLKKSAKLGITSVNDLYASRAHERLQQYDIYKELDEEQRLTTRLHVYPPLNGDMVKARELRKLFNSERLQLGGLKQFIDGVVTGHTAYMLDPYLDKPDSVGEVAYPIETLEKWVMEADHEGFAIRFHTIGDGAVRLGLDLYEKAQQINGKRDARHSLEHIEIISPIDIPRFKELGVMPSIQPYHMALMPRESHTTRVSKEKHPYIYPNKSLIDSGAIVSYSSDYPIVPLDPMLEIYHAVTRMDITLEDTWNEQEKVSLAQALKAYTQVPAFSVFREQELGTLEVGKFADIIVLDRDLFTCPKEEILEAKVVLTLMDGQKVWEAIMVK
ncbi:amidohydrolase [Rummeliibacillus pycnus]|uniref:amidohydrolase n=1 Tax=Rummeliibacillus pycnus TaxID=101070 RepID=UPI000C9B9940|nr:amidohydrolase [Rummeliibacillus pycnus]